MISDQPGDWPVAVAEVVRRQVGAVQDHRRLTGLSGRAVVRVDGEDGVVVVKIDIHPRELQFYASRAPVLAALGLGLPRSFYAGRPDGPESQAWLVLEHLPGPLPRERWLADPAVMSALALLHRSVGVLDSIRDPFRPVWTAEMTTAAVARLGSTGGRLDELCAEAQPWLSGTCPISGDPNPRNWGVRLDATPVLFDWERIGFGHPAIDVGITLPGLPTPAEATTAAHAYLKACGPDGLPVDRSLEVAPLDVGPAGLARALQLVRAWTAVEPLADPRRARASTAPATGWSTTCPAGSTRSEAL